jgi:hypothetical protein
MSVRKFIFIVLITFVSLITIAIPAFLFTNIYQQKKLSEFFDHRSEIYALDSIIFKGQERELVLNDKKSLAFLIAATIAPAMPGLGKKVHRRVAGDYARG